MNFRELGGYVNKDGRTVRHGVFYRSGALADLNREELDYVNTLGIKTIVDLRSEMELKDSPDPVIEGAKFHHLSAMNFEFSGDVDMSPESLKKAGSTMILADFYGKLAFSSAYVQMFQEILKGNTPILFHCSAGKDRTGIGAILILLALGVDEETALDDYMLTNEYRRGYIERMLADRADMLEIYPEMRTILFAFEGVDRRNAEHTLNVIRKNYKDMDTYFHEVLKLSDDDLRTLRERYTE